MDFEKAMEWINETELIEVTPDSIRIRKNIGSKVKESNL